LAISIRQPWAELILSGRKTIELRSWDTEYRGLLWLHTGKHFDTALDDRFELKNLPRGAFVGQVELLNISPVDRERWDRWRPSHLDSGRYQPGMFAWMLVTPERLSRPVPAPGHLKLFSIELDLAEQLQTALRC
jgi:hypothetical protein